MSNKFILITGTSSGLGEATTRMLAGKGYVVFAGVRSDAAVRQWKELNNSHIIPVRLDVTSEESISTAVAEIGQAIGTDGLFALVNNAGNNYTTPTEMYDDAKARNLVETHFWGMASLTRHCIPLLRQYATQQPEGARILSVGSVGSLSSFPFIQFYNAAKFAILGFSDSLRFELKPQNIHVSVVLPGSVKTEIWRRTEETIGETLASLKGGQEELYAHNIKAAGKLSSGLEKNGVSAEDGARVFLRALESRKPRLKYFIGMDARIVQFMVRNLTDNMRHRILNMQLKFR